jgi:hypothetical protein
MNRYYGTLNHTFKIIHLSRFFLENYPDTDTQTPMGYSDRPRYFHMDLARKDYVLQAKQPQFEKLIM